MIDLFDRIRHRLIRWLSLGDFIILNAEFGADRIWRPRNLGPIFMQNVDVIGRPEPHVLGLGYNMPAGHLQLFRTHNQLGCFVNVTIRSFPSRALQDGSKSDGT